MTLTQFKNRFGFLWYYSRDLFCRRCLVWLPSAQRQPPVQPPSCIYIVIITKGNLDQIELLIYKERSLPSRSKSYERLKQIENRNVGARFQIILSKQNQRGKQKLGRKECRFSGSRDTKEDFILLFAQCPTGLFWSDWVIVCDPLQQHAGLCQLHKQWEGTWHHPSIIHSIHWRLTVQQVQMLHADGG